MSFFLLDAGGAAIILLIPIVIIFLVFMWGIIEGFFINLFGISSFWRSVWYAIIVNILSLMAGFVMIGIANKLGLEKYTELETSISRLPTWIVFLVSSVLIEGVALKGLNKAIAWSRIFSTSLVMNIFSYTISFFYAYYYL